MASPKTIILVTILAIVCALCISSLVHAQDYTPTDPDYTPTDPDDTSTDDTPTDPDDTPTDDTPTDPDDTPTDDTPTDPDDTPTDDTPTDPDDTPTDDTPTDDTPTDPDNTPTDPDDTPTDPTDPDDSPTDPDDTPTDPNDTPTDPDDSPTPTDPSGPVSISDVVTDDFFNGILSQAGSRCAGKNFYSRSAFLDAVSNYPDFASGGSSDDSLREIAAFFAHVTRETGHFCYIEEINKRTYCQPSTRWPCKPNKQYYGRGPLQITWNTNYGPAGQSIGFDGLNAPETVANDPGVSFSAALWFWMSNVHSRMASGFGSTIRAINGGECNGKVPSAVKARVGFYRDYCNQFGVDPGNNISC